MVLISPEPLDPSDTSPTRLSRRLDLLDKLRAYALTAHPRALLTYAPTRSHPPPPTPSPMTAKWTLDSTASTTARAAALRCPGKRHGPALHGLGMYANTVPQSPRGHRPPNYRPALARLRTPTLILKGSCDYLSWASATDYHHTLTGSQLLYLHGSGHNLYQDQPGRRHTRHPGVPRRGTTPGGPMDRTYSTERLHGPSALTAPAHLACASSPTVHRPTRRRSSKPSQSPRTAAGVDRSYLTITSHNTHGQEPHMIKDTIRRWHQHLAGTLPGGLDELLADDVTLYSPILHTPQHGRAITKLYVDAAAATLLNTPRDTGHPTSTSTFHYTKQVSEGDIAILEFETRSTTPTSTGSTSSASTQPARSSRSRHDPPAASSAHPAGTHASRPQPAHLGRLDSDDSTRSSRHGPVTTATGRSGRLVEWGACGLTSHAPDTGRRRRGRLRARPSAGRAGPNGRCDPWSRLPPRRRSYRRRRRALTNPKGAVGSGSTASAALAAATRGMSESSLINDMADAVMLTSLLKWDVPAGYSSDGVQVDGDTILLAGMCVTCHLGSRAGPHIPWGDKRVNVVIESTGTEGQLGNVSGSRSPATSAVNIARPTPPARPRPPIRP